MKKVLSTLMLVSLLAPAGCAYGRRCCRPIYARNVISQASLQYRGGRCSGPACRGGSCNIGQQRPVRRPQTAVQTRSVGAGVRRNRPVQRSICQTGNCSGGRCRR